MSARQLSASGLLRPFFPRQTKIVDSKNICKIFRLLRSENHQNGKYGSQNVFNGELHIILKLRNLSI